MDAAEGLERLQQQLEEGEWLLTLGLLPEETERWRAETEAVVRQLPDNGPFLAALEELSLSHLPEMMFLEEALAILAELREQIAASAGLPIPGETEERVAFLPPWKEMEGIIGSSRLSQEEKAQTTEALQALWVALEQAFIPWKVVQEGVIAAARVDRNLFFLVIPFLMERASEIG